MSTLTEIEAAVGALPVEQKRELLAFLAREIERSRITPTRQDDALANVIGAFAGPRDATGRKAEEILYGNGA